MVYLRARSVSTDEVVAIIEANQVPSTIGSRERMEDEFTSFFYDHNHLIPHDYLEIEEVTESEWETYQAFNLFPLYRLSASRTTEFRAAKEGTHEVGYLQPWNFRFVKFLEENC